MIEEAYEFAKSLLIRDIVAAKGQKHILRFVRARFGVVPPELEAEVKTIRDESVLDAAVELAASCSDLEHFEKELRGDPTAPGALRPGG